MNLDSLKEKTQLKLVYIHRIGRINSSSPVSAWDTEDIHVITGNIGRFLEMENEEDLISVDKTSLPALSFL